MRSDGFEKGPLGDYSKGDQFGLRAFGNQRSGI